MLWHIIWTHGKEFKKSEMIFKSREKAERYARYYALLWDAHWKSQNLSTRFGEKRFMKAIFCSYEIIPTMQRRQNSQEF